MPRNSKRDESQGRHTQASRKTRRQRADTAPTPSLNPPSPSKGASERPLTRRKTSALDTSSPSDYHCTISPLLHCVAWLSPPRLSIYSLLTTRATSTLD